MCQKKKEGKNRQFKNSKVECLILLLDKKKLNYYLFSISGYSYRFHDKKKSMLIYNI